MNTMEIIVVQLASAVVHLQEHIDTGELLDLEAAKGNMAHPFVTRWLANNKVLLPVRRDGK